MTSAINKKLTEPYTLVQEMHPDKLIDLVTAGHVEHVIQQNGLDVDTEKLFADNCLVNPMDFFTDPIRSIFGNSLIAKTQIRFSESTQKKETIDKALNWLSQIKGGKRLNDPTQLIIDELFTNAIYNALPFFVGLPDGWDRRAKIDLTEGKSCEIFIGHSENRLILGCTDSFGSLDLEKMLVQLKKTYTKGFAGAIRQGTSGAGVGTRLMFDQCIGFYVGVRVQEQTTVAYSLPLGPKARGTDLNFKNIHLMVIK